GEWLLRAKKKSTCQSIIDYAQRSLGNILGDLELSIILISTCHVSVLELSTCQIFKILVLVSKILYQ
ncbi:hypothetical protein C0J52_14499, partial [Blattella germanica]